MSFAGARSYFERSTTMSSTSHQLPAINSRPPTHGHQLTATNSIWYHPPNQFSWRRVAIPDSGWQNSTCTLVLVSELSKALYTLYKGASHYKGDGKVGHCLMAITSSAAPGHAAQHHGDCCRCYCYCCHCRRGSGRAALGRANGSSSLLLLLLLHARACRLAAPSHLFMQCMIGQMDWTDRHYRFLMRLITRRTLLYTEMLVDQTVRRRRRHCIALLIKWRVSV